MYRKKPRPASLDEAKISRDRENAVIEYADEALRGMNLRIRPEIASMSDRNILALHNDNPSDEMSFEELRAMDTGLFSGMSVDEARRLIERGRKTGSLHKAWDDGTQRRQALANYRPPVPLIAETAKSDRRELLKRFVTEVREQEKVKDRDHFAVPRDVAEFIADAFDAYFAQERKGDKRPSLARAFALKKRGSVKRTKPTPRVMDEVIDDRNKLAGVTWPEIIEKPGPNVPDAEAGRKTMSRFDAIADAVEISQAVKRDTEARREPTQRAVNHVRKSFERVLTRVQKSMNGLRRPLD